LTLNTFFQLAAPSLQQSKQAPHKLCCPYTGLHGVIYQKTGIEISTAVRNTDHASNWPFKNRVPYFSAGKGEGVSELLGRLLKQEEKCIHILFI
jgi:hypothetical protein